MKTEYPYSLYVCSGSIGEVLGSYYSDGTIMITSQLHAYSALPILVARSELLVLLSGGLFPSSVFKKQSLDNADAWCAPYHERSTSYACEAGEWSNGFRELKSVSDSLPMRWEMLAWVFEKSRLARIHRNTEAIVCLLRQVPCRFRCRPR